MRITFSILERIEWAATVRRCGGQRKREAFSILERIEWAATGMSLPTPPVLCRLSVSSNGSNGLRREDRVTPRPQRHPFSILERIEWAATQIRPAMRAPSTLSVSSNGSNGLRLRVSVCFFVLSSAFSILERIEWAATEAGRGGQRRQAGLSVSSNGSNGLRPKSTTDASADTASLSVSSNGSNGLRRSLVESYRLVWIAFQYPRTDRMGCDTGGRCAHR